MYICDDFNDISRYAYFKKELDEPYYVISSDEDFDMKIGNVTPKHFPGKNFESNCKEINELLSVHFSFH